MSPYVDSRIIGSCNNSGVRRYRCRSQGDQSQNSVPECQKLNPTDFEECLDGTAMIVKARDILSQTSTFNSASSPPAKNINTEKALLPASNIDRSTSSEISLAAPFIAVIIISIVVSLAFLFLIIRRGREVKHIGNSNANKKELAMNRSPSPESSLLNSYRVDSRDPNRCSSSSARMTSPMPQDDSPIPDLEKACIIEPPLESHPAYKYLHDQNPNPPSGKFDIPPSPLLSSMYNTSLSSRENLPAKAGKTKSETEALMKDKDSSDIHTSRLNETIVQEINNYDSRGGAISDLDCTISIPNPLNCLDKGNQLNGELTDESRIQTNPLKSRPKSEMTELLEINHYSDASIETLDQDISQYTKSSSRIENRQEAPCKFDSNSQTHVISDRWSGSTLHSEFPSVNMLSDWNIPGAWKSYTCLNEDDICASHSMTLAVDFDRKKNYDSEIESDSEDDEACSFEIDLNDH
ncbi:hypothetical protein GcM1_211001 [Golovinomyces cichoracearum]|uniref:Uncharacterized protein n=1 Tax=Golovinomyces cichoracearum TaxID=62708 RepID=A0A420IUY9_9PEZI|nr:hypothetical protein GcM1_211001 [Golovinomyces cichoracearum]